MSDKPLPGAFELLSRFTHLRETGLNRDDAWYQVVDSVPQLNDTTRNAFLALAKDWERREGHKYRYREDDRQHATLTSQEVAAAVHKSSKLQKAKAQVAQRQEESMLTGTLDPVRLTEHNQQRLEQVLDQLEDDEDEAEEVNARHNPPNKPAAPSKNGGTAPMRHKDDYFGPHTILLVYFKNYPSPLRVPIAGNDELFIGRSTSNSAMAPEIDLNAVNAGDFGVSRMHAAITRRDNKLLITDLESMNYTYVNGMRLFPNEVYILKDGDEIWFAQLQARLRFQHK